MQRSDEEVRIETFDNPAGGWLIVGRGTRGPLKYLTANPSFFERTDPSEAARRLVELAADEAPELVGRPVDVVRLDRRGIAWVRRKQACPETL